MIFYYYLYFISSLFVFIERKLKFKKFIFFLIFIYLFLIILIGFRFEVGGDWENYNFAYTQFAKVNFLDIFTKSISDDILFDLVQWISFRFFNNIYLGNILCAFIFVSGLIRIAYVTPYPFFFITLAIPYLLVAVSMGYTRQSVAIGLFMWGICLLLKKNNLSYFFLILFGSFFHKSAALLFFFLFVNIPLNFTKLFYYCIELYNNNYYFIL